MAEDRLVPTSATPGAVSGDDYMDAVAEEISGLWNRSICELKDIGGTGNAITASLDPALVSGLVDGMAFWLTPAANNTGATTIAINGASAVSIVDLDGNALSGDALVAGRKYLVVADSGSLRIVSGGGNTQNSGGTPVESKSAAYTLVLGDAGKTILHPSSDTSARTFTIPSNASVSFPVGTIISFINQNGAGVVTIAITSNTMRLAGAGTTGNRTLVANGVATAQKIATTEWIISGVGLT